VGHEPIFAGREPARPGRDPIRTGREALMASLERPLGTPVGGRSLDPTMSPQPSVAAAAASGDVPRRRQSARAFYEEDSGSETPAVPSLAVLRPRRTAPDTPVGERPAKRGPSWDDVLFGAAPTAKDA
jgi:hypothetical protein